jgi:hypothetical protein
MKKRKEIWIKATNIDINWIQNCWRYEMHAKHARNKRDKSRNNEFGLSSQNFQEMVSKYCRGQSGNPECLAMMHRMMERTRCGPKTEKTDKK